MDEGLIKKVLALLAFALPDPSSFAKKLHND